MNKTIFIIALVFAIIIGGGYFLINSNPQMKLMAEKIGVINAPAPTPIPANYNAVFCIFDVSGSGKSIYSVPIITVDFIRQIISAIAGKGYGELWLTFVDRSALNNKVLHFTVPEKMNSFEYPIRNSGERKGEFDKRLAAFRADSIKNVSELAVEQQNYNTSKDLFLKQCSDMIVSGYALKERNEDYSDVIGSLNAAIRSLATVDSDSLHFRSILLLSDGVQDIPAGDTKQQLKEIPDDVLLVTVNNSGSVNSVVAGTSVEVDNLDRGLDKIIRVYKLKK